MTDHLKAARHTISSSTDFSKSIACLVDTWIAERHVCDQYVSRWQYLEHKLSLKAKAKGLTLERAAHQPWPETKAMHDLMRRITAFDRRLPKFAEIIMRRTSVSTSDAMAKLRLGLAMRRHCFDGDNAWALIEKAYDELHRLGRKGHSTT